MHRFYSLLTEEDNELLCKSEALSKSAERRLNEIISNAVQKHWEYEM